MISLKSLVVLCLAGLATAGTTWFGRKPGCGQVDVFFTGLPPYHPLVKAQGFDPALVDSLLRADAAAVIKAGYNLKVALAGPEQPITALGKEMRGTRWEVTGVGYGVRGTRLPDLTLRFTELIQLYREQAPQAPIVFNFSPNTTLWAVQQRIPLSSTCEDSPGKDLGFDILCDPTVCTQ